MDVFRTFEWSAGSTSRVSRACYFLWASTPIRLCAFNQAEYCECEVRIPLTHDATPFLHLIIFEHMGVQGVI